MGIKIMIHFLHIFMAVSVYVYDTEFNILYYSNDILTWNAPSFSLFSVFFFFLKY